MAVSYAEATTPKTPSEPRVNMVAARILLERYDEGYVPRSRKDTRAETVVSYEDWLSDLEARAAASRAAREQSEAANATTDADTDGLS